MSVEFSSIPEEIGHPPRPRPPIAENLFSDIRVDKPEPVNLTSSPPVLPQFRYGNRIGIEATESPAPRDHHAGDPFEAQENSGEPEDF